MEDFGKYGINMNGYTESSGAQYNTEENTPPVMGKETFCYRLY